MTAAAVCMTFISVWAKSDKKLRGAARKSDTHYGASEAGHEMQASKPPSLASESKRSKAKKIVESLDVDGVQHSRALKCVCVQHSMLASLKWYCGYDHVLYPYMVM